MFDPREYIERRDPTVATFKMQAVPNRLKSAEAGRPIFDDIEMCEIRFPGSRDVKPFPAHTLSTHWVTDPETGEQRRLTYAERFPRQYRQFKESAVQTKSGTPLDGAKFLTAARRAELNALNIYTVEQLASVDGQELKNLGPGGRDLKNQAQEFIDDGKRQAPNIRIEAELEALRARNQALEADNAALQAKRAAAEAEFDDMSNGDIAKYIEAHTGQPPVGQLGRKTLIRMAMDARPKEAAA